MPQRVKITLFILSFLINSQLFAERSKNNAEKYLHTLDFIHLMGKDIYCYWDIKKTMYGVDWDKIITDAKNKIHHRLTRSEFQLILLEVGASVKDGHVNFNRNLKKRDYYYLPVEVKEINNKFYISNIDQSKFSYHVEFKIGDELIEIDNMPTIRTVRHNEKYSSGSTPNMIRSTAVRRLKRLPSTVVPPRSSVLYTIKKWQTGEIILAKIPWQLFQDLEVLKTRPGMKDLIITKILPGNVGYLKVKRMKAQEGNREYISYIHSKINDLMNTDSLIIDVRNNGGGSGSIGDAIISRFIDKEIIRYKSSFKASKQVLAIRPKLYESIKLSTATNSEFSTWKDTIIRPFKSQKKYQNPVVLLTNERCFSACDTFADSFSSNQIGIVLGKQTGGGTGYPMSVALPYHLGRFSFSVLRGMSNYGRFLEGTGTIPDIPLGLTPEGLASKEDRILMKTHQFVKNNYLAKIKGGERLIPADKLFSSTQKIVPFEIEERQQQQLMEEI